MNNTKSEMKTFTLNRKTDVSGISGSGVVCEGCIFSNGKVALNWLTEISSIVIHDSLENVRKIHGHNGDTEIIFTHQISEVNIPGIPGCFVQTDFSGGAYPISNLGHYATKYRD